jgi:hypothetical protein
VAGALGAFRRIVLVNEAGGARQGIQKAKHGIRGRCAHEARFSESLKFREAVGLDARVRENMGVRHEVAGDDTEPPAFQGAGGAAGSAEGVHGNTGPDAARAQRAPDEVEETRLVSDVSHGREYS